jgi:uncharacterized protein YcbK (DUF882 family)
VRLSIASHGTMPLIARRTFLAGLCAAIPTLVPTSPRAATASARVLTFQHLHTGERLVVEYSSEGRYLPDALAAVNQLLRDFRTGDVATIDPALLDLLHDLAACTGSRRPFEVISGYRSPATNEMLRRHSDGVASGSLHMRGQAIDVRLADIALDKLRDAARGLRRGGVGYYPSPAFVHLDTGRVRAW